MLRLAKALLAPPLYVYKRLADNLLVWCADECEQCGDVMRLHIKVDPETQVITETRFKTFGCGSAM